MNASFLPTQVKLLACARRYPNQVLTNEELLQALTQLSGKRFARKASIMASLLNIETRYFSRSITVACSHAIPSNSDLVTQVINDLCQESNVTLTDIDYLLGHTTTPDTQLPPNIAWVADKLNYDGLYAEFRQACTGFSSALQFAVPRIAMLNKPIAIVGSETGSVYFDYAPEFLTRVQLVNYMQMGDGAGGVLLGPDDGSQRGIISHCFMGQIGVGKEPGLQLDGGSNSVYTQGDCAKFIHDAVSVKQQGEELFHAGIKALNSQGFDLSDFDYILPHQASGRIDEMLASKLDIPIEKIINDARTYGNLGSAAIWCSLANLIHSDRLKQGDKVVILGAEATKYLYGGFIYTH